MRTIYCDFDFKCHTSDDGTMTIVETDFFDGKCDVFVEGYRFDTSKGYVQIHPWKPYVELDNAQRAYERQKLAEYEVELAKYEVELAELDSLILDYQYNSLTEGL